MDAHYIAIDSQEALDDFLKDVAGFHDALLREVAIVNRGYVDPDGWMTGDQAPSDARLVFHSQFPNPSVIEVVLTEISVFRFESPELLIGNAHGVVSGDSVTIFFGNADEDLMARSHAVGYRILGREQLGSKVRTVEPIQIDNSPEGN